MPSHPRLTAWAETKREAPPRDHLYRSATWLLGRHPRLAHLVVRIAGVVDVEDGEVFVDVDHLAAVIAAAPEYAAAWQNYETRHRQPEDESEWYRWRDAGPAPGQFAVGLSDFLVMSSGEVAALRLLATFATQRTPFRVSDLTSLDDEGQRLLADWSAAVQASYGTSPADATARSHPDMFGRSDERSSFL
jgi:hypothetical protein